MKYVIVVEKSVTMHPSSAIAQPCDFCFSLPNVTPIHCRATMSGSSSIRRFLIVYSSSLQLIVVLCILQQATSRFVLGRMFDDFSQQVVTLKNT